MVQPVNGVTTREVHNLAELVSTVVSIGEEAAKGEGQGGADLWFRGVTSHDYSLKPKIYRSSEKYLSAAHNDGKKIINDLEPKMISRFTERSAPHLEPYADSADSWSMLFVMQHYGAATRLLDWTENLLVAAHFAAGYGKIAKEGDYPAVWVLQPRLWNKLSFDYVDDAPRVFTPGDDELESISPRAGRGIQRMPTKQPAAIYSKYNNVRIIAQQGVFTISGSDTRGMDEQIEESLRQGRASGLELVKIIHRGGHLALQNELDLVGASPSTIFPGLQSVCKELDRMVLP